MDKLVGDKEQSSFVPSCQIVNNIVIMQEAIHTMHDRTREKGAMVIKFDLEKAYHRLKWSFIHETLSLAGFPSSLINIIMDCIFSVKMHIL